jgi:hypothetical protein
MKNRPCPQKLAEAHDYDDTRAQETLKRCFTQGSGWHMSCQQFNILKENVSQICHDACNPGFKRDITYLSTIEDDEDTDL